MPIDSTARRLILLIAAALPAAAHAQNCTPYWDGTVGNPGLGPPMMSLEALCAFDDGSGPAVYATGFISVSGTRIVNGIARSDGDGNWSPLGDGFSGSLFTAGLSLTAFDDGSGPALYVGGSFAQAGGVSGTNGIAKWDGAAWHPLGRGVNAGPFPSVKSLAVFDSGNGPELYAGGWIQTAYQSNGTSLAVNCIARWNGSSWNTVGEGLGASGEVNWAYAMAVFDDGNGPELYAGGTFVTAGGVTVNHIARWDGSSWSALGDGMDNEVWALCPFDDGSGSALYAGGHFGTASGVNVSHIARWDGSAWSALGSGTDGQVRALAVFDDGTGPALYAGGGFATAGGIAARSIARWNGHSWSALGDGLGGDTVFVNGLAAFEDDASDTAQLYVGGEFATAGGQSTNKVAAWVACSGHTPVPGDFDDDGDRDLDDYRPFGYCLTGPGGGVLSGCEPGNLDHDDDVDLADFARFQEVDLR